MEWIGENAGLIFAVLFAISEVLAQVPGVRANSIFQLIFGLIRMMRAKFPHIRG